MSFSEPVHQPANDLVAFDISRQSPEQIAKLFARWKEQRKRLIAPASRGTDRPPHLRPVPPVVRGAAQEAPVPPEEVTPQPPAEQGGPIHYSASFEALLTSRAPSLALRVWNPDAGLQTLGRPHPPRRRSRMKWVLAGAASVVALAAIAGGALWERPGVMQAGDKPAADTSPIGSPAEAALPAAPIDPMDIPLAEPFVARAIAAGEADWPMRQAVDLALMKAAPVAVTAHLPLMPKLKPPVPVVQTASKPSATKPASAPQPEAEPNEAGIARVELPLVTSVTATTVSAPVAPATDARADDPHPDGGASRGNDKSNFTFGANNRAASSSSKSAAGPSGPAHPGSGSAGGSTGGSDPGGSTGGSDPGGSTGGSDPGGSTGGSDPGGSTGGSDPGGGTGGSDPGGGTGGSDPGGGTGGSDPGGGTGGSDPGGGTGGSDPGGGTGGSDPGGGTGGSDPGGSGSGEGGVSGGSGGSADGGGVGGAVGGAVGGLGDAVGGALGGGKDSAKGDKDKDKDKDKAKDKAD